MSFSCQDATRPQCILSVIGFGHVSANCCVIIRRRLLLLHHVGTRALTLVVVSWVNRAVLAFTSALTML